MSAMPPNLVPGNAGHSAAGTIADSQAPRFECRDDGQRCLGAAAVPAPREVSHG